MRAKFIEDLPAGKHSTFGVGEKTPDSSNSVKLYEKKQTKVEFFNKSSLFSSFCNERDDGVEVPCGKLVYSGFKKGGGAGETDLMYNEYIVYDTSQIRMRYLMKLKFNFK